MSLLEDHCEFLMGIQFDDREEDCPACGRKNVKFFLPNVEDGSCDAVLRVGLPNLEVAKGFCLAIMICSSKGAELGGASTGFFGSFIAHEGNPNGALGNDMYPTMPLDSDIWRYILDLTPLSGDGFPSICGVNNLQDFLSGVNIIPFVFERAGLCCCEEEGASNRIKSCFFADTKDMSVANKLILRGLVADLDLTNYTQISEVEMEEVDAEIIQCVGLKHI